MDRQRLFEILKPPCGTQARRLIGAMSIAVGLPRLPLINQYASLPLFRFGSIDAYGIFFTILGIALIVTSYRWRFTFTGRLIAAVGFAAWIMLAFATISATSFIINCIGAATLMAEVWTVRR